MKSLGADDKIDGGLVLGERCAAESTELRARIARAATARADANRRGSLRHRERNDAALSRVM